MTKTKRRPKAAPPPAPTHDVLGIEIQPWAREAFAALHKFDALATALRDAIAKLDALEGAPGAAFLSVPEARARLEQALRHVEAAKPRWTDCPLRYDLLKPHSERCRLCRGEFWCAVVPPGVEVPPEAMSNMLARYEE